MIAMLEPLFQGELAPHGEALQYAPQPPVGAMRVADLVQSPELLGRVLRLHASHLGVEDEDLRAVASAWSLDYLGMLLPPVAAAASVLQHGFPAAAEQVWVRLDSNARPASFHIRELGQPQRGMTTAERYSAVLRAVQPVRPPRQDPVEQRGAQSRAHPRPGSRADRRIAAHR